MTVSFCRIEVYGVRSTRVSGERVWKERDLVSTRWIDRARSLRFFDSHSLMSIISYFTTPI